MERGGCRDLAALLLPERLLLPSSNKHHYGSNTPERPLNKVLHSRASFS
jgi:hypothetical protein